MTETEDIKFRMAMARRAFVNKELESRTVH